MVAATEPEFTPAQLAELERLSQPFQMEARGMLAGLKDADVTPAVRRVLESLTASALIAFKGTDIAREKRQALEQALEALTLICEAIPRQLNSVEVRLAALEARHGR